MSRLIELEEYEKITESWFILNKIKYTFDKKWDSYDSFTCTKWYLKRDEGDIDIYNKISNRLLKNVENIIICREHDSGIFNIRIIDSTRQLIDESKFNDITFDALNRCYATNSPAECTESTFMRIIELLQNLNEKIEKITTKPCSSQGPP